MRRPAAGEAEERRRWCDGFGLSSAEEDVASDLEAARLGDGGNVAAAAEGSACLLESCQEGGMGLVDRVL